MQSRGERTAEGGVEDGGMEGLQLMRAGGHTAGQIEIALGYRITLQDILTQTKKTHPAHRQETVSILHGV